MLDARSTDLPSYKAGYVAILKKLFERGATDVRGHLLFALSDSEYRAALLWIERVGLLSLVTGTAYALKSGAGANTEAILDKLDTRYMESWQAEAGMKTYGQAVADVL